MNWENGRDVNREQTKNHIQRHIDHINRSVDYDVSTEWLCTQSIPLIWHGYTVLCHTDYFCSQYTWIAGHILQLIGISFLFNFTKWFFFLSPLVVIQPQNYYANNVENVGCLTQMENWRKKKPMRIRNVPLLYVNENIL